MSGLRREIREDAVVLAPEVEELEEALCGKELRAGPNLNRSADGADGADWVGRSSVGLRKLTLKKRGENSRELMGTRANGADLERVQGAGGPRVRG